MWRYSCFIVNFNPLIFRIQLSTQPRIPRCCNYSRMKTFQQVPGWDHSRFTESMMSDLTPSFAQEAATMPIQSVTNSQWKISAPSITAYNPKVSYVKMKSNIDCLINTTGLFYPQNVVFEMTLICHNKEIFKTLGNRVDQLQ